MSKKRKTTITIVMILSLSMFASNLSGLMMAVKAADFEDFGADGWDDYEEPADEPEAPGQDVPQMPSFDQPTYEEPEPEVPQGPTPEELQRMAEEEAARQAAEEAARQAQEEEIRKQAEAAAQAAKEEEERRAAAAAQAAQQEAERLAALEREAKEAEAAAKKQEEEKAAEEAKRKAEEEAKRAAEEAEKARKAAEEEEKRQAAEDGNYAIRTQVDGGAISHIILTSHVGEGDSLVFNAVNVGNSDIDLVYGISGASGNVFAFSLLSGSSQLNAGGMDKFQVAINPAAPVGKYSCTLYLKDRRDDGNKNAVYISVSNNFIYFILGSEVIFNDYIIISACSVRGTNNKIFTIIVCVIV